MRVGLGCFSYFLFCIISGVRHCPVAVLHAARWDETKPPEWRWLDGEREVECIECGRTPGRALVQYYGWYGLTDRPNDVDCAVQRAICLRYLRVVRPWTL